MIQGLIFDMDGVLIDSHSVHRDAWRNFLSTLGKNASDEELAFILEGRRREEILQHFLGPLSAEKIAEYGQKKDQFFEDRFEDIKLVPGVQAFLHALQSSGFKLGLATSASASRTWSTLCRLELKQSFSAVVTGDDVSSGKPNPAVYRVAARRMEIPPDDLVALEDSPSGVRAARSAGLICIGVVRNGRAAALRDVGAIGIIPDFVGFSTGKLLRMCSAPAAGASQPQYGASRQVVPK